MTPSSCVFSNDAEQQTPIVPSSAFIASSSLNEVNPKAREALKGERVIDSITLSPSPQQIRSERLKQLLSFGEVNTEVAIAKSSLVGSSSEHNSQSRAGGSLSAAPQLGICSSGIDISNSTHTANDKNHNASMAAVGEHVLMMSGEKTTAAPAPRFISIDEGSVGRDKEGNSLEDSIVLFAGGGKRQEANVEKSSRGFENNNANATLMTQTHHTGAVAKSSSTRRLKTRIVLTDDDEDEGVGEMVGKGVGGIVGPSLITLSPSPLRSVMPSTKAVAIYRTVTQPPPPPPPTLHRSTDQGASNKTTMLETVRPGNDALVDVTIQANVPKTKSANTAATITATAYEHKPFKRSLSEALLKPPLWGDEEEARTHGGAKPVVTVTKGATTAALSSLMSPLEQLASSGFFHDQSSTNDMHSNTRFAKDKMGGADGKGMGEKSAVARAFSLQQPPVEDPHHQRHHHRQEEEKRSSRNHNHANDTVGQSNAHHRDAFNPLAMRRQEEGKGSGRLFCGGGGGGVGESTMIELSDGEEESVVTAVAAKQTMRNPPRRVSPTEKSHIVAPTMVAVSLSPLRVVPTTVFRPTTSPSVMSPSLPPPPPPDRSPTIAAVVETFPELPLPPHPTERNLLGMFSPAPEGGVVVRRSGVTEEGKGGCVGSLRSSHHPLCAATSAPPSRRRILTTIDMDDI